MQIRFRAFTLAAALLVSAAAGAQQIKPTPQRNGGYDASREAALQGTVISFTAKSQTPPMGAHMVLQTSSGRVDVHLGNAALLTQNHIEISVGDSVRILGVGVTDAGTSFFAARILQKGSQSVALRNTNGIPLAPGRMASRAAAPQGGAQ
jgi:hypothetical protein